MTKVSVPPWTLLGCLGWLKLRPVGAVHGEREGALGELDARLVVHQAVGTQVVNDLMK